MTILWKSCNIFIKCAHNKRNLQLAASCCCCSRVFFFPIGFASFSNLHILISVEKVIIAMFKTIAVHNFSQVFANQIMHLFYMLYAYVFIVPVLSLSFCFSIICVNVISKTWAHFVASCIKQCLFSVNLISVFSLLSIQHVVNWRY